MARLPSPTMAHPSFFPGGSGTTSSACAFFSRVPATLTAKRPWPAFEINPLRVISLLIVYLQKNIGQQSAFDNYRSCIPSCTLVVKTCDQSRLLLRVLLMDLVQPLLQIVLIFLLQLWIA